jgi:polar amino acid transport system substrate-binding protein
MRHVIWAILSACFLSMLVAPARADTLDDIRKRGEIRWGADQSGGGPYVYPDPASPDQAVGFEVDLMELLAKRLGVRSEFKQCEWTNLPDLLRTGDIDVIVNGYELTEDRLRTMIATMPYYIYELQLITRRDDSSIKGWDDLERPAERRKKIGALPGSAAQKYVKDRLGDGVAVENYEEVTLAMEDVQNGKLDATVQDLPAAIFYRDRYAGLHFAGPPVGRGYYVMYLRRGDEALREELNAGLRELSPLAPSLRSIYKRYGIWNDTQEKLGSKGLDALGAEMAEKSTEFHGWDVVGRNWPLLRQAAAMTVLLSLLSMPLAILTGLLVALGRLYGPGPLRPLLTVYVEVLRGTPLLLQLLTIFFVLPSVGIKFAALPAAVLGLAINYSAYESEIYRAGLLAIPVGQMEAALSLGMSRRVALRRIIVPQAVRMVIPPVTNDFIALFKDTSLCSVITIVELTKQYGILANSTGAYLELAMVTALLYLLMSYPLSLVARRLERRVSPVAM